MKSETERIPKILVKVVEKDWSGSGQKHATDGSKNEVDQKAKDQKVMQIQVIEHAKDRQRDTSAITSIDDNAGYRDENVQ